MGIAILVSALIIGIAATLGRATLTLKGAVVQKPDIAVLLLMEKRNENATDATLLKDGDTERDYLVETSTGPKWVRLKKGEKEWYIAQEEALRE